MADPTPPASTRRSVREARRGRAKRVTLVGLAVVMALAIAGVALVVTGVLELPGADRAAAGRDHGTTTTSSTTTVLRPVKETRRALTHADPLRLWIAGDSLAGSVGPSLGELAGATGVVQPQFYSKVSSGLTNPSFFDWPRTAKEQLAELDPEVVVFVVGTNDANVWDPSQTDTYKLRTLAMMKQLVGGSKHREVLWLGAPVAKDKDLEAGVKAVNLIAREAAQEVPGVTYVDTHSLFDDDQGRYQQSFADETGKVRVMRAGDGIHFSVDGGDFIGRYLFRILDARWRLARQADPTQPLSVRETEGTTQYPGTHRDVGATVVGHGATNTTTTTRARTGTVVSTTTTTVAATTTTQAPTTTTTAPPATTTTTAGATTGGP
jgi:uncharacterized protein